MSGGYFNRGASAGGHDEGYFNRDDVTGSEGVGSATGGPGGVAREDIVVDEENPNVVRAVPGIGDDVQGDDLRTDETAGTITGHGRGSYPDMIEGSDSPRTGTSWDYEHIEGATEGEGSGQAHPNRNTGSGKARTDLDSTGGWSTIEGNQDSAGSPTGNS